MTATLPPAVPKSVDPALPTPAGPLSAAVVEALTQRPMRRHLARIEAPIAEADPYGLDLQLALYVCYELHYRGFAGVDPRWEWNPALLHLRAGLEEAFLTAVGRDVGRIGPSDTAAAEMDALSVEPVHGSGPSWFLREQGSWTQLREYFVHRSLYHLKEADPHAFAIPRLIGQAKASFVAVEFDEYGGGRGRHLHQQLFADLMVAAGLNADYLGYIDAVGAEALAVVNLMSLFGLHRRLRGAAVGHFAATEITSSPGSRRLVEALQRLGAPEPCAAFYREHVVADAVHEQVVRADVVGDLLAREPRLEPDVVFGMRAFALVEDRLADRLTAAWTAGRCSLRLPLD
ncbi:iron-containing redox enzyme family protein [uncultured Mycolicibacterium sp.]|uniref:iron-containing redox enzyme family protein n=1 Tax=uncultured Mycolicibacterium sp. TaxID=2320817 RepID=UPI002607350C|nr:iron-containing redox enzyme family protein [uncultured Mycolicibacterium sp.]